VNRPNSHFRGYSGTIAGGRIRPGDAITVLPSGKTSTIERITTFGGDLARAVAGQSVTLTFADEIDCSRGDIIAVAEASTEVASRFDATLVWMSEEAMVPHRSYWLKIGSQTLSASIDGIDHIVDVHTLAQRPGATLGLNDIGRCEIDLDRRIAAVPYEENRALGGFILIDKVTHSTVAAGMVQGFPKTPVRSDRESGEAGRILWLKGSSPAEKAAYALRAQERLKALGRPGFVLDEAAVRAGLNSDLGAGDAAEARRRVREVARLMSLAGVTVIVAVEVSADEARPGTIVDVDTDTAASGDNWTI
jgi:bifunctional enzyme CysN/CysC